VIIGAVLPGTTLPGTTLPATILPATTTDSLALNSAPVGADAVSNPQSSGGVRRGEDGEDEAGRQNVGIHSIVTQDFSTAKPVEGPITGLGVAQITNAAATDNTGTSTDARDRETAPPVTKNVTKFEPRRPSSDAGHRDGLAGAVNAGLDQLRSSLSPKKPSGAASDGSEAGESGASGG
jgi:hypothetical protein